MLRDLLGDYPSFDTSSFGGASLIPESTFDDAVNLHFTSCYQKGLDCLLSEEEERQGKVD